MRRAIEAHDLHKRYGDVHAVRGVDLTVAPGEVLCLLGPNGAGKTTLVELLEGHRLPSAGSVSLLGRDPARGERALRDRVGVVLQGTFLQDELTVVELLEMHARWYDRPRPPDELLELVELDAARDARARDLSGGQRRRLDLALGLAGRPDVLFLDEPTTGFDPHARRQAWRTIQALRGEGLTVLLTTHMLDEAQALADRVAVLAHGEIVAEGPPELLGGRHERPAEIRFALPDGLGPADVPTPPGATLVRDGDGVLVTAPDGVAAAHRLTGWALERDVPLAGFRVAQPTLEDVYLSLTEAHA